MTMLKAGGAKVRCESGRNYAVTVQRPGKPDSLKVLKRSDYPEYIRKAVLELSRKGWTHVQIFELYAPAGKLIWAGDISLATARERADNAVKAWHTACERS